MGRIVGSISRAKLPEFLEAVNGRMMTVEFRKKDGEHRRMTGRTGVKKFTKGGKSGVANYPNYRVLWEIGTPRNPIPEGGRYRTVNLNTVERIHADGMELRVLG